MRMRVKTAAASTAGRLTASTGGLAAAVAALTLLAFALPGAAFPMMAEGGGAIIDAAEPGTGKTVSWGISRSGSAGVSGGTCGSRLQCFKNAVTQANLDTTPFVENAALVMINVADADQDVNMAVNGKQFLIAPDADPNNNGKPDVIDALNKLSLGGGTCFTCALQAAEREFATARPESQKVIVLVSERTNTFRSTGFTSTGQPTGYPPMEMWAMAGHFDANTVVRAFAVGPEVSCAANPNGPAYGSLNNAAAVTPGGTCTDVASFETLGAVLSECGHRWGASATTSTATASSSTSASAATSATSATTSATATATSATSATASATSATSATPTASSATAAAATASSATATASWWTGIRGVRPRRQPARVLAPGRAGRDGRARGSGAHERHLQRRCRARSRTGDP